MDTVIGVPPPFIKIERTRPHWIAWMSARKTVAIRAVKFRFQAHHIGGGDPARPFGFATDCQNAGVIAALIANGDGVATCAAFAQCPIQVEFFFDDVNLPSRQFRVHINLNRPEFTWKPIGV